MSENFSTLRRALGPGLLLAGAAIGVSHLVQATRAGAEFGLALAGLILVTCVLKYPFLEFGPRYAAATGEHLLTGYRRLGRWALGLYMMITISTMCIVMASVTLVTAGLLGTMLGLSLTVPVLSLLVLFGCALILGLGHYRGLDLLMKLIMTFLAVATLLAVLLASLNHADWGALMPVDWRDRLISGAGLAFALALLGWMPIPLDAAAWHSLWTLERAEETGSHPSVRAAGVDFAIGYTGAVVLALAFLLLGALMMFGQPMSFEGSAVAFAAQLVEMYGRALGTWAMPLIGFAALATMFSTTLTVADAFPRVLRAFFELRDGSPRTTPPTGHRVLYLGAMALVMAGAWVIIAGFGHRFTLLIDFITTVSFLAAPVIGWLNLKLLTSPHTPAAARPGPWMRRLAHAGLIFLFAFAAIWVVWRLGLIE